MNIRDRVIRLERVPASQLQPNPKNWRTHPEGQQNALRGILAEVGIAGAVLARETPEGGLMLIDGHLRAETLQNTEVPVLVLDVDEAEADKLLATIDPLGAMAEADADKLRELLEEVETASEALADMFTDLAEDAGILDGLNDAEITEDEVPVPPADPITKPGDLWLLGDHRLLCGDSTKAEDVARLMEGAKAALIHADPPYGMGKEKDGVANDNLYADKLDAFQMAWWKAARLHVADNGSAYIWGNAENLWRLWYRGGLKDSERLTMRNEIVWGKGHGQGIGSADHRMFPTASERCLFFMLGEQGFNNNADNYWEGWDSVVNYLRAEKEKTGWDIAKFKRLAGHSETSGCHWFDKSQWMFPTKEVYESWQRAAREHDAFKREHDELKREHDELKREHDELKREFYSTRAYFDNTHDNMTDVWEFPRVTGEDRHEHATPKPVAMIQRCIKSSTPPNEIVMEPFLGSGTTLIAAEQLGRKCYGMEISPAYCDVIVKRWETLTGRQATREGAK